MPNKKTAATQIQSAPMMVSKELVTSIRTPINAQPPIIVPMTSTRLAMLIRRGSTSFGTSIDFAAAAFSRT